MDPSSFDELLKVQRMMASKIIDESSMDLKINLLDLLRDLPTGKKGTISIEQIIVSAQMEGIMESDVLRVLDELKKDHMVSEPELGFIKLL